MTRQIPFPWSWAGTQLSWAAALLVGASVAFLPINASARGAETDPVSFLADTPKSLVVDMVTAVPLRHPQGGGPGWSGLPIGRQTLATVNWQIDGVPGQPRCALLRASPTGDKIEGIKVGRRAHLLHFLQTMQPGPAIDAWEKAAVSAKEERGELPPEPPVVARYLVHYADGVTLVIPVRWGEAVQKWHRRTFFSRETGFLGDLKWARLAWKQSAGPQSGHQAVLYSLDWPNPRLDQPIASLDVVAGDGKSDLGTLALLAISTSMTDQPPVLHFVAPDGDDSAAGTLEKPWATPEKAAAAAQPGDTVYFRAGRYTLKESMVLQQVGKEKAWTTFAAFPGETAILDAIRILPKPDELIWAEPLTAVRVAGTARYVRIKGLRVENSINNGIHAISEQVEILYNTVYNTWHTGIWGSGKDVRIIGNTLLRVCRTKTLDEYIQRYPDLANHQHVAEVKAAHARGKRLRHECLDCGSSGSDGVECAYNEIAYGDKEGIDCKGGPHNVHIHHNYVHHITMTTGLYIDAWTKPMVNVEVDHNIVCNTAVTGIAVSSEGGSDLIDVRVHHNLSFDNGCSGLLLSACAKDGLKKNIRFEYNTVFRNGTNKTNPNAEGGLHLGSAKAEDIVVQNNIYFANRDYGIARNVAKPLAEMGIAISHNLVQPPAKAGTRVFPEATDTRRAAWIHEPGENAVSGDPQFVDPDNFDFRLKPGSPAIGTGRNDDGKPCDLGAFPIGE